MPQPKKKSKSSPSRHELERAAWQALLEKQKKLRYEEVPPGWLNYEQFAEKMGTCTEVAAARLRALARAGLCERREFKVKWGDFIRPRPFFKLK
jgi:hypothetical protein